MVKKKKIIQQLNLWIPLFLVIPLMILEMVMMIVSSFKINEIAYSWCAWFIATVVIFYFGREWYKYCFYEIFKKRTVGMSTLVTLSSFVAYSYSLYLLIYKTIIFSKEGNTPDIMSFFEVGATIIAIVNAGEYIASKISEKSNNDIKQLSCLLVPTALLLDDNENYKEVDCKTLKIGDKVYVKKGQKIPIDGIVLNKSIEVDESLLTGESKSIFKDIGDKVIGGSINLMNDFILEVTTLQNDSLVNSIIKNVKKIDDSKIKIKKIVDIVSKWFTPTILVAGVIAFVIQMVAPDILNISSNSGFLGNTHLDWINGQNEMAVRAQKGLYFFIATLSISCPCALGIAAPLAMLIGVGKGAKNGIIFNDANVFEKIKKIKKIAFDKTGTLTTGNFKVVHCIGDEKNLIKIYKMEQISFHPISKSFIKYFETLNIKETKTGISNTYKEIPGIGIIDEKNDQLICSLNYANKNGFTFLENVWKEYEKYLNNSKDKILQTIVVFSKKNVVQNIIFFEDEIRDDAALVINQFKKMKIDVAIVTGDSEQNARFVAKKLGIQNVYANVTPNEKSLIIKKMQEQNNQVAYVGDGINDLEALKQSDLSFSITTDNESAKIVSDVNLIYLNINNVYKTIKIAKQTRINIITNLIWAFGYNIITVPLAVLGFIPALVGVYIMMLSDITVNLNSLFFKMMPIKNVKVNNK